MLGSFAIAMALVVIAELGDKTQLLVLGLAARYRPAPVLAGVVMASLAVHGLSVALGTVLGDFLPDRVVAVAGGVLFVAFGLWTLLSKERSEDAKQLSSLGPALTVAVAFFLAELGDKTQLMSMTLAADPGAALEALGLTAAGSTDLGVGPSGAIGVWLGASTGMIAASLLAILLGRALGRRLPVETVRKVSGMVLLAFGALMLIGAILG